MKLCKASVRHGQMDHVHKKTKNKTKHWLWEDDGHKLEWLFRSEVIKAVLFQRQSRLFLFEYF